jgi:hypothetical protein
MIAGYATCLLLCFAVTEASQEVDNMFDLGMCTHFSQQKGIIDLNLQSMKDAGISAIRDEAAWSALERTKGVFSMPERFDSYVKHIDQGDVDVMLILDYANPFYDDGDRPRSPEAIEGFCRYSEYMAKYFSEHVRWYEIWNEWDIPIGLPERHRKRDGEPNRGLPEDYFNLLKEVYPRVKAANPGVTVLGGCPTPGAVRQGWLEKIIQLGALDYCDAISIHTYNYGMQGLQRTPEAWHDWMLEVQAMLRKYNNGVDPDFYVTEMGWPTHAGERGTSPELSASYLGRLYLLARTMPSFKGLWWYDFQDDGWNAEYNENNFGIVRPDLTPKPAYYVTRDISTLVRHGQHIDRLNTPDEHLWILRFRHDGEDVWAIWSGDDQARQVVLKAADPGESLLVQQSGHAPMKRRWGYLDWAGNRRNELEENQLSIVVGHRPYILRGNLGSASVVDVLLRSRE